MYTVTSVPWDLSPDKANCLVLRHSKSFPTACIDVRAIRQPCTDTSLLPLTRSKIWYLILSFWSQRTCLKASKNVRSTHQDLTRSLTEDDVLDLQFFWVWCNIVRLMRILVGPFILCFVSVAGKFLGIVGRDLVILNPTGYMLTSSSFVSVFIWRIFYRFFLNDR